MSVTPRWVSVALTYGDKERSLRFTPGQASWLADRAEDVIVVHDGPPVPQTGGECARLGFSDGTSPVYLTQEQCVWLGEQLSDEFGHDVAAVVEVRAIFSN